MRFAWSAVGNEHRVPGRLIGDNDERECIGPVGWSHTPDTIHHCMCRLAEYISQRSDGLCNAGRGGGTSRPSTNELELDDG